MSKIDWNEVLSWKEEQREDLRIAGFAYIRQGKYDLALPFFQALVVLEPENVYDNQTLGAIYLQMEEAAKAIRYLDQALKLNSTHSLTLLNLAKALLMINRTQEALKLAKALENDPDREIASIAKALILAYN